MLPVPSRKAVARAGQTLINSAASPAEHSSALQILSHWRALHHYPVNTFQATLRKKCTDFDIRSATIAQRLKRAPSIIAKLTRFPDMRLDRMQDIGGLRVVVPSLSAVDRLHHYYLNSPRLKHEVLLPPKDYIQHPKPDGYRSLHQVFKYLNTQRPELNGLRIELQIRTRLQHAWATSIETLGILEKSSFKTGEGSAILRRFFLLCSALFAAAEGTPLPDDVAGMTQAQIISEVANINRQMRVLDKLRSVAAASARIDTASTKRAAYHVIQLDLSRHTTSLFPFTAAQFDIAQDFYLQREQQASAGGFDVVLVSVGDLKDIKKAYPNYFLDTHAFVKAIEKYLAQFEKSSYN